MKSYQNRTTFGGEWSDNLHSSIQLFESLCKMCRLTEDEKLQSVPVMLRDRKMKFYSENFTELDTYEDINKMLEDRYTSKAQKGRMFTMWKNLRLSEFMKQNP